MFSNQRIIRSLPILLLSNFVLQRPIAAQDKNIIVVNARDIFDSSGKSEAIPVKRLSVALSKYPKVRFFRIIWWKSLVNTSTSYTCLYDRRNKNLTFYSWYSHSDMGLDKPITGRTHCRFSAVQDFMIHKIAKRHFNKFAETSDDMSFLSELTGFKCKRKNLS